MRTSACSMFLVVIPFSTASILHAQATTRVSVDSSGAQGDGGSYSLWLAISSDGRFVAFASDSTNLVPGDTNAQYDVFVRDRLAGTTERVSVDSSGAEANGGSGDDGLAISGDGRFVAFTSRAGNLVPSDTNGFMDVFVRDRLNATTELVSVDSGGVQGDDISHNPSISADGRFVVFTSPATNLVAGDTNGWTDVFVHDRSTGTTERVNVDSAGNQANRWSDRASITADGRFVAFESFANNLILNDTNTANDVFVRDRQGATTSRVSVDSAGKQALSYSYLPTISADGRFVAFASHAANLVSGDTNKSEDEFVHDCQTGTTERVSVDSSGAQGNRDSGYGSLASVSQDGRYVAFVSVATNLVTGDTNAFDDVFVRDRQLGLTRRVSVDSSGAQANDFSESAVLAADGRFVAFHSLASNLVANDTSGIDTFVNGANLTLEIDPSSAPVGATITFGAWTGASVGTVLLVVTDVNGAAMFLPAVLSAFDAAGAWTWAATVPPGLSGSTVTFEVFGIVPTGKVDVSNSIAVAFN